MAEVGQGPAIENQCPILVIDGNTQLENFVVKEAVNRSDILSSIKVAEQDVGDLGVLKKRRTSVHSPFIENSQSGKMHSLPELEDAKLSREFDLGMSNVDVTSIDIATHGCYVLVGCSNGMVMLFGMNSPSSSGILVGHIKAKGLHTNLLLSVKITEDSRFAFAGVMKGSMEMLAIDMGKLPVWPDKMVRSNSALLNLVNTHSHMDPKLRGLGAVVRVHGPSEFQYRLVCGKGIKNVHIWSFFPDGEKGPIWICLYDVASNGNTIETMAFRRGGEEVLSKSSHMGVRVWRLNEGESFEIDTKLGTQNKLNFEDIPNTQDARLMLEDHILGGTYNFVAAKMCSSKLVSRDSYEVPERTVEDDQGQRRKRQMRLVDEVVGTQDGKHALALCSDGGVLYFRNDHSSLIESSSLQRHSEGPWSLRRVGKRGSVVLLRPKHVEGDSISSTTLISVKPLTIEAIGEVPDTRVALEDEPWNLCGYYSEVSNEPSSHGEEKKSNYSRKRQSVTTPRFVTPAVANVNTSSHSRRNISPNENLMQIVESNVGTPMHKEVGRRCLTKSKEEGDTRKRRGDTIESGRVKASLWKFEQDEAPQEIKKFRILPLKKIEHVVSLEIIPKVDMSVLRRSFSEMKKNWLSRSILSADGQCPDHELICSRTTEAIKYLILQQDRIRLQFVSDVAGYLQNMVASWENCDVEFRSELIANSELSLQKIFMNHKRSVFNTLEMHRLDIATAIAIDKLVIDVARIEDFKKSLKLFQDREKVIRVFSEAEDPFAVDVVFRHSDMFEEAKVFFDDILSLMR